MSPQQFTAVRPADHAINNVLEPLVSYICAAERPRAALLTVYKALLAEVEQTNRAARAHNGVIANCR